MHRASSDWSSSRLLLPLVAIVVIIAATSAYLFFEQTPSPQTLTSTQRISSTTSDVQPSEPVRVAVNQMIQGFNNRNVTAIMNFYDFSADEVWDGNAQGLQGAYAGSESIRILYGSTIGKTTEMRATINDYSERVFSPTHVNVTLNVELKGKSTTLGLFNGTVRIVQEWFYSAGQWVIVLEHWSYKTLAVEFPAESTTFPQWSALRAGESPDLVSEKSLEWNAGPMIVAAVYAFLICVLVVAATKWSRRSAAR